jgi:uncharacterized protein with FMN-binding domain
MKKYFLSGAVVVSFIVYSLHQKNLRRADNLNKTIDTRNQNNNLITPNNMKTNQMDSSMMQDQGMMMYQDGEYIGDVTDAYYGLVQVKAIVNDGKITDIIFLKYPSDRRTSIMINNQATPFLKQEAISAQSASVNIVTGATQTSRAFKESLTSALNQAI